MKNLILAALLLLLPVAAQTSEPPVNVPQGITVLEQDRWGAVLELRVPAWELVEAVGPDGPCRRVRLEGWARTARTGWPELPLIGCAIPLAATDGLQVEVLHASSVRLAAERLYPVPPLRESDEAVWRAAPVSGCYPSDLVRVDQSAVRRGSKSVRLVFQPFQWDAAAGQLVCAEVLRVRLSFFEDRPVTPSMPLDGGPTMMEGTPGIHLQGALRIEVEEDGLYAMDFRQAMLDAGLDEGEVDVIDPATLKLFNQGHEIPMAVAQDGHEAPWPGGTMFFYGEGIDSQFTATNVYWLYWGGGTAGARMTVSSGAPVPGAPLATVSTETLRFEENHRLWETTPGAPANDYWFWDLMTAPATRDCQLYVPRPAPGTWEGTLRVCYQGRSTASPHPNHHTQVLLNAVDLDDQFWDGDQIFTQETGFSSSLLNHGWNTVSVDCPGDTGATVDSAYLNWIEVEYRRRLVADDDSLLISAGNGPENIIVQGFTGPLVAVLDITDPLAVRRLTGVQVSGAGSAFSAIFGNKAAGGATYLALTPDSFRSPVGVASWSSPGLRSGGTGADWIIITPREFLAAVQPLVNHRMNEGFRAMAVAVEDVYNEFSHGLADPAALKAFLGWAYGHWPAPAPLYVLLLGDANTDYLDHFGTGKLGLVPVHLSLTELGLTPDDNWYVAVEGDDVLPEMCIGRLPASDAAMAERVVTRLLASEQSTAPAPAHAMFVADDEAAFEQLNETLAAMLPKGLPPDRVYLSEYGDPDDVTEDIVRGIGRGEMIVHYNGHGSVTAWAGEDIFNNDDAAGLGNDDLPFVLTMTCLNGYFAQPFTYCLGEVFATAENGGGLASLSPSGLSYTWEQGLLAPAIFDLIFTEGEDRLGVIVTEAKSEAHALGATDEMVSMFTLLGDPASRLKSWE